MSRIVVAGLAGLYPVGGVAWDYLQYVIGLHRMGHDVFYHEDTWSWPYDPVAAARTDDPAYTVEFLDDFFRRHAPDLRERWHYRHLHEESHGAPRGAFERFAADADLFLNVSGGNTIPEALGADCVRAFVDTDPGYNQIVLAERPAWSENVDRWAESVAAHDIHFTYAENVDADDCAIPDVGTEWIPTRMPVVLDLWDDLPPADPSAPWTTVMTWNAFAGPLVHGGREYFSKDRSFESVLRLPEAIDAPFRIAIGGMGAPTDRLQAAGWEIVDAPSATRTAEDYRDLIAGSCGEFSVAKHVYVALLTGWFSCRSACYLAAGRPVVVEDTGFSRILPTGSGLLAFTDMPEARDAIERVSRDYDRHRRAAREVAAGHFDSHRVLTRLLDAL